MPLLEMRNIVKEFPGVRALDGVSFTLEAGEFHSIVGENGAGKSTLMKVLSGVYPEGTFEGEILVNDSTQHFRWIRDSEAAGIAIIFQELSLVKEMTVGENIFLGREPSRFGVVDWARLYHKAATLLRDLHLDIDPRVPVGSLGIGRQQLVEIAKALSQDAKILVLDEPTTGLHLADVEQLLGLLDRLVDSGKSVIVIEHHQAVMAHADWIIDLGPGAGHDGGRIVFEGTPADLVADRSTLTGQHLATYVGVEK